MILRNKVIRYKFNMNFDEEYRGFSPYATFGTWKKVALAMYVRRNKINSP